MQRIFITHTVSKEDAPRLKISIAACNFSQNLMEGGLFDKTYTVLPSYVRGKLVQFTGLIYSPLRKWKIINKLAPIFENIELLFRIPSKSSVWYYNCTSLNMPLILLLKIFKRNVKQNMIILDFTPNRSWYSRFSLWLTNQMDGTIRLADSSLFSVRNSVCIPGVVPNINVEYPRIEKVNKEFLISGVLSDNISMLPLLLETFSELPDIKLHITGKAPNSELVKSYTDNYTNIIYHGLLDYNKYLQLMHNVSFILSTRNPSCPENECNFPSKIIEALLHNRIIVSTIHYKQLSGIQYFEIPVDKENLIASLRAIINLPDNELLKYANQSEKVKNNYNCNVWGINMSKIENFIK